MRAATYDLPELKELPDTTNHLFSPILVSIQILASGLSNGVLDDDPDMKLLAEIKLASLVLRVELEKN